MPERRFLVGGNWKSNGSKATVEKLATFLNSVSVPEHTDVVVAPPFLYLETLQRSLKAPWQLSAQTVSATGNGAYTGEISASQLQDFGITWTLIGHSERRQLYHATDDVVAKQLTAALQHHMHVIACVGETQEERKQDRTMAVISAQLHAIAGAIPSPSTWTSSLVIAYEPVWAIGTGQTATAQQAQEVHAAIRKWLSDQVGTEVAAAVRIIYGGSVQAKNAVELIQQPDVDGFLVGGASLKEEFGDIVQATKHAGR